jgi:methionine-rich copper-binding protein CopC
MGVFARALSATAVILLPALAVALVPVPASAHDSLVASTPEDGQSLRSAPEEVVLTFSGEVMDVSTAVLVLDSRAESVHTTDPLVRGHDVSVELPGEIAEGGYAVRWRVVSGDGHPISGTFTFEVGEGGPPPPPLDAVPEEEPVESDPAPESVASGPVADLFPRTAVLALVGALGGLLLHLAALRLRRPQHTADSTGTVTTTIDKDSQ